MFRKNAFSISYLHVYLIVLLLVDILFAIAFNPHFRRASLAFQRIQPALAPTPGC
jgi:hypothetical protein